MNEEQDRDFVHSMTAGAGAVVYRSGAITFADYKQVLAAFPNIRAATPAADNTEAELAIARTQFPELATMTAAGAIGWLAVELCAAREAMQALRDAVGKEMDPSWECNSYHPSLHRAMEQTRAAPPAAYVGYGGEGKPKTLLLKADLPVGTSLYAKPVAQQGEGVATASDPENCDAWCPRCQGSGEETVLVGGGPDADDQTVNCQHCDGHGTLYRAYTEVVRSLKDMHKAYLDACAKLYAAPSPSAAPVAQGLTDEMRAFVENIATARSEPLNSVITYRDRDSRAAMALELRSRAREILAQAAPAPSASPAYADSTPHLRIGDSSFESWYQAHPKACGGDKQLARDAYAAGMGDPLVMARDGASPAALTALEGFSITPHVDGCGWVIVNPDGTQWFAFKGAPAGDFMAALLAASPASQDAQPSETKCKACGGNDGDVPCAYPDGSHSSCLRVQPSEDKRDAELWRTHVRMIRRRHEPDTVRTLINAVEREATTTSNIAAMSASKEGA